MEKSVVFVSFANPPHPETPYALVVISGEDYSAAEIDAAMRSTSLRRIVWLRQEKEAPDAVRRLRNRYVLGKRKPPVDRTAIKFRHPEPPGGQ